MRQAHIVALIAAMLVLLVSPASFASTTIFNYEDYGASTAPVVTLSNLQAGHENGTQIMEGDVVIQNPNSDALELNLGFVDPENINLMALGIDGKTHKLEYTPPFRVVGPGNIGDLTRGLRSQESYVTHARWKAAEKLPPGKYAFYAEFIGTRKSSHAFSPGNNEDLSRCWVGKAISNRITMAIR